MNNPPARGVRLAWAEVPARVRAAVETWLGSPVVEAKTQPAGFSPGVAARLRTASGRRVFAKAIGPEPNPRAVQFHRREARNMAMMLADVAVPRLLWAYDEGDGGWVVLIFEEIDGHHPAEPWRLDELDRVLHALDALSARLTPSPLPAGEVESATGKFEYGMRGWRTLHNEPSTLTGALDPWSQRHLAALAQLEAEAPEAVAGDTLLHFDIRADNVLLTAEKVWFVDWPHARTGAAWVDVICFAPSVAMQGGPPPEVVRSRSHMCRDAAPEAFTAAVASVAGFFTYGALQPPPPGLPTLRAFQAAQGEVARAWLAERTGWK